MTFVLTLFCEAQYLLNLLVILNWLLWRLIIFLCLFIFFNNKSLCSWLQEGIEQRIIRKISKLHRLSQRWIALDAWILEGYLILEVKEIVRRDVELSYRLSSTVCATYLLRLVVIRDEKSLIFKRNRTVSFSNICKIQKIFAASILLSERILRLLL